MSSWPCCPATRSSQLPCTLWGVPSAFTKFQRNGWGGLGRGDGLVHICSFILSTGFSSNEYRPLQLKCCSYYRTTFLHCCCLCWNWYATGKGGWVRQNCPSVALFLFPWWRWLLDKSATLRTTSPPLSLGSASTCTSLQSAERAATLLHCYSICWGCCNHWTASVAPFCVLPAPMPFLLTPTAHLQMS